MSSRVLSTQQARAFYDRFGKKQDLQRVYEDPALDALVRHAGFETSRAVFEFGCGTGRLAERLLRGCLPASATYVGLDISETMVRLARARLEPWKDRAEVRLWEGAGHLPIADRAYDRFLSTYVLDLLGEEQIAATLHEARRVLVPGGRLCLVSLTFGRTIPSRLLSGVWSAIHLLDPRLVGGCRPLHLDATVDGAWQILHHETVCRFGLCSEVLVAS